jgi:hypothetical protein
MNLRNDEFNLGDIQRRYFHNANPRAGQRTSPVRQFGIGPARKQQLTRGDNRPARPTPLSFILEHAARRDVPEQEQQARPMRQHNGG